MALGFMFRLQLEDGTPADPPSFPSATLNWVGDMIPLGAKTLRVVESATTTQTSRRR